MNGGVCSEVEYHSGVECAGVRVEMSRAYCCSASHGDSISSPTPTQNGETALDWAKRCSQADIVSVLEQVVRVWMGVRGGRARDEVRVK